jgi:hypothetical protein
VALDAAASHRGVVLATGAAGVAMTVAADDLVPIEALRAHRERFRCIPLVTVLTAGACLLRQRQAQARQDSLDEPFATPPPCLDCADGRRVRERLDAVRQEILIVKDVSPANTDAASRCTEPGCDRSPGGVRSNTPAELVGYCVFHRKKKMDQKRWSASGKKAAREKAKRNVSKKSKSSPAPTPVPSVSAPSPTAFATPSLLAELHALCVSAGRTDLALQVGTALAESVRGGKS